MQPSAMDNHNEPLLNEQGDTKALDVGAVFSVYEDALNAKNMFRSAFYAGEYAWIDRDALHNAPESLVRLFYNTVTSHDDALSLKLAITLFEMSRLPENQALNATDQTVHDDSFRERYANAAEKILKRLKSKTGPNELSQILPDVLEYYLGSIALKRAEAQKDSDSQKDALEAYSAFTRAKLNRNSSFYHLAAEGALKACILADASCQAEDAIRTFMATYPDYPGMPSLRLAYAKLLLKHNKLEQAQTTLDALVFDYPWTEAATEAMAIMQSKAWVPSERNYNDTLAHVDFLRKKRFWKLAEKAAAEALEKYPEDVQLLLQDARIQYEQSYHEVAFKKFEHLLEVLNGEKKDGIRPVGVIAYMYRAAGYMGDCKTALELHEKTVLQLGRKDRQKATLDYALTCGAFDVMWENALALKDTLTPYDFGFYAYLAHEYETAREKLSEAAESLTGSYKRRANYFYAMATLKSAQAKAEAEQKSKEAAEQASPAVEVAHLASTSAETITIRNNDKQAKKKKSSNSKKTKTKLPIRPPQPEATIELAQKSFRQIISEDSTDYYAILANSRLMELNGSPSRDDSPLYMPHAGSPMPEHETDSAIRSIQATYAYDEQSRIAGGNVEAWLHTNVEKYAEIWPELRRIEALHRAGLWRERNEEFRPIIIEGTGIAKMSSRPVAKNLWHSTLAVDGHLVDNRRKDTGVWGIELTETYFHLPDKKATDARNALADHQQLIFDDRVAIRGFLRDAAIVFHDYYLARRNTSSPKSLPGTAADNENWSVVYPHAYNYAIVEASRKNGLSPYLLWTLMNIESAFNHDSISISDAYGLLQIIPVTGYKLAESLGIDPFGPYDLIKPENSIPMGAWYFGQIVKKFKGYATLSMAGYNGGPFQVARWLTAYAGKIDHDAFIELIPFNEARNYVKKGMARLLIFKRIDEGDRKYFYYIPNELPTSFEFMPNF